MVLHMRRAVPRAVVRRGCVNGSAWAALGEAVARERSSRFGRCLARSWAHTRALLGVPRARGATTRPF